MLDTKTVSPSPVGDVPVQPSTIRRFYAFQLITRTEFTGGIWILYLSSRGYSLPQIGLAEAAFHLARRQR